MDRRVVLQAAAAAALTGTVAVIVQALNLRAPETGLTMQPSTPAVPIDQFLAPIVRHPAQMLRFFAADSLFVLSYSLLYTGLFTVVAERGRAMAVVALGAGLFGALCDAVENAFFITYASLSLLGQPPTEPDLPLTLIFVVANLKWMGAYLAFGGFGLLWPRRGLLGWLLSVLMMLVPLIGVLAVAVPALLSALGALLLVGMPLFAWTLWQSAREAG